MVLGVGAFRACLNIAFQGHAQSHPRVAGHLAHRKMSFLAASSLHEWMAQTQQLNLLFTAKMVQAKRFKVQDPESEVKNAIPKTVKGRTKPK